MCVVVPRVAWCQVGARGQGAVRGALAADERSGVARRGEEGQGKVEEVAH